MKRPNQKSKMTYAEAVALAALNDEPTVVEFREVQYLVSTLFIADIFGRDHADVAKDIIALKLKANQ